MEKHVEHYDVVILGSGEASGRALAALRGRGEARSVLLVGARPQPARLKGPVTYRIGAITIERDAGEAPPVQRIDVVDDASVVALDMKRRTLELADGRAVEFGRCIIADRVAGGRN